MSNTTTQVPDDQLTPRDVIIKVIEIKDALLKNWKILVLFCLLGAGIGYGMDQYLRTATEYEATMVFNLGASGGGGGGGMGDLAGLVGLGGTPDANIFVGENFFYFVTSRPVIERTLMKELSINGQKTMLANFFIDSSGIRQKEWEDREDLVSFHFKKKDSTKMSLNDRILLNQVVEKAQSITGIKELGSKSSFITLTATTENANLSVLWLNTLLETVEEVYTENQTRKTRKTLRLLERRADSLAAILSNTETRLARALYNSSMIIDPVAKVPANKLERSTTFIQGLYTEAVASAERMRVSLVKEAPLFTIIEDVKLPLDAKINNQTRLKIGALSGLLLALVVIYFKSVFNSISEKKA
jgi:hypothetical protein